jgi:hypothetical protein
MKRERRRSGSVIMQVLKCTASVTPGRHRAGGDPPRSVRRPFRLEKPFMPSLQRIPVKPAVNKREDRFQILPEGQRGGARKRLVGALTRIETRHLKFPPRTPLPVENGEVTLAVIFYRMRNKPWTALRFLECGRKQVFKALDLRISVRLLQYCESCEGYAVHPFPLLPVPGSCGKISSGANVVRYLSANSTVHTTQTSVAFAPSFR